VVDTDTSYRTRKFVTFIGYLVGILRTTLMELGDWVKGDLYSGCIVRVANSFVFKEPVFNYSADFPFLWDEITFPIKYGSDWKLARNLLHDVVREVMGDYAAQSRAAWKGIVGKYRIENANVEPMITLRADENWIEFTLRYVVDYKQRRTMKDKLYTRILEEIDKSSDRVRIAVTSMELSSSPPLEIEIKGGDVAPGD
jgi:small-conductance mechanosensitive channel